MLSFKPITLEDKDAIMAFTLRGDFPNCDYAFANMCSWSFLYESQYAVTDDFLFVRFYIEEKGRRHRAYMFPVGNGELKKAIEMLEQDAEKTEHPLLMLGVTPESKHKMNALFPDNFTYIMERNYFDYIYLREDLVNLRGKKYQPKRNHIHKFKKQYAYTYLPVTPDLVCRCMEVERIWCKANLDEKDQEALAHENRSMTFALQHFEELGLSGGAILVDDKIIAFTYGSPINNRTFGIHVEKADIRYEGVFSVINQEFASRIPPQYTYINREEDLGISGLRKSKLSYYPVLLLEKNSAVKRR
jgi:hypothetical protein